MAIEFFLFSSTLGLVGVGLYVLIRLVNMYFDNRFVQKVDNLVKEGKISTNDAERMIMHRIWN